MAGYFCIERDLLMHKMWLREPFTRGQAWVDLIGLANHKADYLRIAGEKVEILRGQCGWSMEKLAARWKWSRNKISRFLRELELDARVIIKRTVRTTIISIVNYEAYQNHKNEKGSQKGSQKGRQKDTNKKKEEEVSISTPYSPPESFQLFPVEENSPLEKLFDEEFFPTFPKKRFGNRQKACAAFVAACKRAPPADIISGAKRYAQSDEVARGFAKGAAAWLNDDRWGWDYGKPDQPPPAKPMQALIDRPIRSNVKTIN